MLSMIDVLKSVINDKKKEQQNEITFQTWPTCETLRASHVDLEGPLVTPDLNILWSAVKSNF